VGAIASIASQIPEIMSLGGEYLSAAESMGMPGSTKPMFPNGNPFDPNGRTLPQGKYEEIVLNSVAFGRGGFLNQFIGEPVPRISKNVGDLVLQGSNNASIVLGAELKPDSAVTSTSFPRSMTESGRGSIDICVGRGQTSYSAAGFYPTGVENERGYYESAKRPSREISPDDFAFANENSAEGGVDQENDLSRIYLAMKTDADEHFSIDIENIDQSEGGKPAIVLKSTQLRLVAREDLKIVIGDAETGSAVVLKSDGNIVFVPGKEGVIKLGGDDADKAILTAVSTTTVNTTGQISLASPVTTIAGGILGKDEESATLLNESTFATKVLVK
jgi:hypothetical protein